jgi:uncharacterized protein YggU (UPF0235/DUF167 family)
MSEAPFCTTPITGEIHLEKVLSTSSTVRIEVAVRPLACADEVLEWVDGALRIRVAAPAKRGRADAAVESLLAEVLGISPDHVRVVAGRGARRKCVEIENYEQTDLDLRLPGRDAPRDRDCTGRPAEVAAAVRPTIEKRCAGTPAHHAAALRLPAEQHYFQRRHIESGASGTRAAPES